ncbi:sugar phosphate nucleotidyltransferase [Shewanella woodyi]|uniref:sugar phosphate nucleotidyltransferase n=1 Tax=Shewanella woodyi TaxID=60961 RepID=UPI0007EA4ADA|nr:NDP-sugar synthase [Shewanella woodyi]
MQAIIFANRIGDELAPLDQHYCPALLPVGNKPVIEYTLEDIATSGISEVKLIISSQAQEVEQQLGDGERWGIRIEYFLSKPQEKTKSVLNRLSLPANESILIIRGDIFRSPCIASFISFSRQFPNEFVQAKMANENAGMSLLPAAQPYLDGIDWPLINHGENNSVVTLVLHGLCNMLDSFQAYLQVNLSLARNDIPALTPMERSFTSANPEQDFYVGAKADTQGLDKQHAWGIIGENSKVDPSVEMKNTVVIGNDTLIDKGSMLENCLILPHTYVGEGLEVNNSILCKNLLINLNTDGHILVDDQALIGPSQLEANITPSQTHFMTRLFILTILLISLPFWPILATYSLIRVLLLKLKAKPIIQEMINDNLGQSLVVYSFNTPTRIISLLPQLCLVLTGQLDLFGAPAQIRYASGQNKHRLGVFGPVQLLLDEDAPEEERSLLMLEFDNNSSNTKYLSLLKQSLFMPKALHSQESVNKAIY